MKITLILSMLLFNVFCMGQQYDTATGKYYPLHYGYKSRTGVAIKEVDSGYIFSVDTSYRQIDSVPGKFKNGNWYFDKEGHSRTKDSVYDYGVVNIDTSDVYVHGLRYDGVNMILDGKERFYYDSVKQVWSSINRVLPLADSATIINDEIKYYRKRDTVPVIMLVCDTWRNGEIGNDFHVWAKSGYSVRELQEVVSESNGINVVPFINVPSFEKETFWKHLYYLDADKKQLSKLIIVWQSINSEVK